MTITNQDVVDYLQGIIDFAGDIKILPKPVENFVDGTNLLINTLQSDGVTFEGKFAAASGLGAGLVAYAAGSAVTGAATGIAMGIGTILGGPITGGTAGFIVFYNGQMAAFELSHGVQTATEQSLLQNFTPGEPVDFFENFHDGQQSVGRLAEIANELETFLFGSGEGSVSLEGGQLTINSDQPLTAAELQAALEAAQASNAAELDGVKNGGSITITHPNGEESVDNIGSEEELYQRLEDMGANLQGATGVVTGTGDGALVGFTPDATVPIDGETYLLTNILDSVESAANAVSSFIAMQAGEVWENLVSANNLSFAFNQFFANNFEDLINGDLSVDEATKSICVRGGLLSKPNIKMHKRCKQLNRRAQKYWVYEDNVDPIHFCDSSIILDMIEAHKQTCKPLEMCHSKKQKVQLSLPEEMENKMSIGMNKNHIHLGTFS